MSKLKKNNNDLVLVLNGDDWEGLYVHGKKVFSNHHVDIELISEWSAKLQMVVLTKYCTSKYNEKVQEIGDFDDNLSDIELE